RGVVLDDAGYVALFENPTTHQTQNAREGDMLDGGMIMHLTLHGFEFAVGEKKSEVAIGQNLQGETVAPPVLPNPTAVAATPPAGQKDGGSRTGARAVRRHSRGGDGRGRAGECRDRALRSIGK